MGNHRLGVKQAQIDGTVVDVKGGVSYSLGGDKVETVMGVDGSHGQHVTRLMGYLEMTIFDSDTLDVKKLTSLTDSTIKVDLENGKHVTFGHAHYAGEGKVNADDGEIEFRVECDPNNAQEI